MVCLTTDELPAQGLAYLQQFGEVYVHRKSRSAFLRAATSAPFRFPNPLQVSLYYFKDVAEHVRKLASSHDAIFCNLIRTSIYAENLTIPKFCDLADSISGHYLRLLRQARISTKYPYYLIDTPLISRYERHVIRTFNQCFLFNQGEMDQYHMPDKLTCIPHGVNPDLFKIEAADDSYHNSVVFFGKMDTEPNVAAAIWFARNVMPLLPKHMRFVILGANPSPRVQALANEQVRVLGFVEDPYAIIRGALAVVAPMQFGGGIQNKLLEAMSVGGLCIATSIPARALNYAKHGKELLVADDPEIYAQMLASISKSPGEYNAIRTAARTYIERNHSWNLAGNIYTREILTRLL
ncbi:MAG: glycosyltransferase [Acidobacteriaceae bacterium]